MQTQKNNLFDSDDLGKLVSLLNAKRSGNGYLAKCPCHDDRKESLSFTVGDTQPLIFKCFAGCAQEQLTEKLKALLNKESRPVEKTNLVKLDVKQKAPRIVKAETIISAKSRFPYYLTRETIAFEKLKFGPESKVPYAAIHKRDDGNYYYGKPAGYDLIYCQLKLARLRGKVPVIICEGEKDCDNLNKALGDDYVAITNDEGGATWNEKHANHLKGCDIIIAEDCDDTGRKRTKKIIAQGKYKQLLGVLSFSVEEVGEKGDVSDWLESHSVDELRKRLEALRPKPASEDKKKNATFKDYVKIIESYSEQIGKCIFSGKPMYLDSDGIWKPLENKLGAIRSEVRELDGVELKYSPHAVCDHFEKWSDSLTAKLLVDIPEWDGKDRILEICSHVRLNPECIVSELCFMALTKEWLANVFRKLEDPTMDTSPSREFILILTGKEKIGKDYWIRSLLCGLGQFFSPMSISHNERDNLMQLHQGLVLNLAEFDQTSRVQSSFLKDIVTKSSTNMRGSHARAEEYRFSRTNFIASANMSDLLRDSGANTRYAIFELESIDRKYTKSVDYSLQILAQAKFLAGTDYVAPDDLWEEMREFIKEMTPDSIESDIAEVYEFEAERWRNSLGFEEKQIIDDRGYAYNSELTQVFSDVSKKLGVPVRRVRCALSVKKYKKRSAGKRGYFLKKS